MFFGAMTANFNPSIASVAILLTAGAVSSSRAELNPAELQSSLDAALSTTLATGGAAAIVRDGRILWHGQSGVIAPGSSIPVGPDTLFAYASVGKMSTATLTLRLVEQGKLSLDSPIESYLAPSITIPGADQVTVRQLLNHTSGFADIEAEPSVQARMLDMDHVWSEAELLAEIRTPVTPPGATFSYSNTNYILLSSLISHNAGMSFAAFYDQEIKTPLGLTRSFVTPRPREEFAQGVQGAGADELRFFELTTGVPTALYGELWGDGPIAGNAADGALFLDGLIHGKLLGPEALSEMLSFDTSSGYGLGISGDGTLVGHSGSWGGFTSLALYDSTLNLTFMTLANQMATDPTQPFAPQVLMDAMVTHTAPVPEPTLTSVAVLAITGLAIMLRGKRKSTRSRTAHF